ncbi:hypothetical protein LTR95_016307, partial [Oleoguttula sp. CCFEE 5521]
LVGRSWMCFGRLRRGIPRRVLLCFRSSFQGNAFRARSYSGSTQRDEAGKQRSSEPMNGSCSGPCHRFEDLFKNPMSPKTIVTFLVTIQRRDKKLARISMRRQWRRP